MLDDELRVVGMYKVCFCICRAGLVLSEPVPLSFPTVQKCFDMHYFQ